MRFVLPFAIVASLLVSLPSVGLAQECFGVASLRTRPLQIAANTTFEFAEGAQGVAFQLSGGRKFFVQLDVGWASRAKEEGEHRRYHLSAASGYELGAPSGRVFICPTAALSVTSVWIRSEGFVEPRMVSVSAGVGVGVKL